ncbi:hypothetical protein, partial [Klebsiella pneumoniae]|uniref:hypothetical protein n=1 Tax=Klebsiella pneumoniae TaxID=573 RepID=UPI0021578252
MSADKWPESECRHNAAIWASATVTAKRNRERYAPECGATAGSEPRHGRLALALPVRAPEECRPAPPARHVSTTHLRRFVLLMQYESAVAAEHYTGVRAASI